MQVGFGVLYETLNLKLSKKATGAYPKCAANVFLPNKDERSPNEFWSSISKTAKKYGLKPRHVVATVVDLLLNADETEVPFFVEGLKWYSKDYEMRVLSRACTHDNVSRASARGPSCKATSSVSKEIVMRLQDMSRLVDPGCIAPLDATARRGEVTRASVERLCRITAILVREGVIDISQFWSVAYDETFLQQLDSVYKRRLEVKMRKFWTKGSVSNEGFSIHDELHNPDDFVGQCKHELCNEGFGASCPLRVWLTAAFVKEDLLELVYPDLAMYRNLACAYGPLYHSLEPLLSRKFDNVDDTRSKFVALLRISSVLGPHFGENVTFFRRACSLCSSEYLSSPALVNEVLLQAVIPALSLYKENEDASEAVWRILSKMDTQGRFDLYERWRSSLYKRVHALSLTESYVKKEVSALIKQLSNVTIGFVGKRLALLATTNPLLVWKEALCDGLLVDNLIPVLVKLAVSYGTSLSQDALFFTIFDMCKNDERPHFQEFSLTAEPWFKNLSLLVGSLFAESTFVQEFYLAMYLEYLAERVVTHAAGLVLLADLLTQMTGISQSEDFSDTKAAALGGSLFLKREILFPTTVDTIKRLAQLEDLSSDKCASESLLAGNRAVDLKETPAGQNSAVGKSLLGGIETYQGVGFPSATSPCFAALRHKSLGQRILMTLSNRSRPFTDISNFLFDDSILGCSLDDFLLEQLLGILQFGPSDILEPIPTLRSLLEQSGEVSIVMHVVRPFSRPMIDIHSLDYFDDVKKLLPNAVKIDRTFYALFWIFEAYDVDVPDPEYYHEAWRIAGLGEDGASSPEFCAARTHIIDSLETSRIAQMNHVMWCLERLPSVDLDMSQAVTVLDKMILSRAILSQADAHYTFCFMARTIKDPVPLLDALFDGKNLFSILDTFTEHRIQNLSQFLREIWVDLVSWVFRAASGGTPSDENADNIEESNGWIKVSKKRYALANPLDMSSLGDKDKHWFQIEDYNLLSGEYSFFEPSTSKSAYLDTCTIPACTLFRSGSDMDKHVMRWEEHLLEVISSALDSALSSTATNALLMVIFLAGLVPRRHETRRELMEKHIAPLAYDTSTEVRNLVEKAAALYNKI